MTGLWKRALRALVTGDRAFIKKLLTYLFKVGQVTDLCHALVVPSQQPARFKCIVMLVVTP